MQKLWRFERPGRALSLLIVFLVGVSGTVVVPGAVAAPAPPARNAPATPPNTDEAADIPSARATARVHKHRVEALSERTEAASTWVNPDGNLTTQLNAGPVRVKRGDAWLPVDLNLEKRADGSIAAKAHPRDLVLAGAGGTDGGTRDLASVRYAETEVALQWTGKLPQPRLEGRKATYPDVRPDADLVVEATRTGFEQFLVLKKRPKGSVQLRLPLRTKGATLNVTEDGDTELLDAAGKPVGAIPQPEMWDSRRDEASGEPLKRVKLGKELLPMATASASDAAQELLLTADQAFLDDKSTEYPVIIDPTVDIGPTYDKYVQTGTTRDTGGDGELRLGTFDGGSTVARSYLNFDMSPFRGRRINNAKLYLWEFHSYSCGARNWQVWNTDPAGSGTHWGAQPRWYNHWATSSETTGHSSSCGDGWVSAGLTPLVQAWADAGNGEVGVVVKAENEGDNYAWKKFDSAQAGFVPHIFVDYNSRPDPATGINVSDRGDFAGQAYTRSTTPTLSFRVNDPDGEAVAAVFRVFDGNTMIADQWIFGVPSGTVATWKVPDGLLQQGKSYKFQATSHDNKDWAGDGFYSIRPVHSGRSLDVSGCSTAAGALLIQWDYWAGGCQRFYLHGTGDGHYLIGARHSGHVLDVSDCGTGDGVRIKQWVRDGNDCQRFKLQPVGDGEYTIVSKHSGKVLDIESSRTDNGAAVWIWTANGCGCQRFKIEAAPDPGITLQSLQFTVDTQKPGAPFVSSSDYPNDNKWHKGSGQAGVFGFRPPAGTNDVAAYVWGLDAVPATEVAADAQGNANPSITPATDGQHALNVRIKDRAGHLSDVVSYTFHVGRAGLVRPAEGARVPKRLQLQADGESVFTHVKFLWRRGPGAPVESDIPTAHLTKADGGPLGAGFVPLTSYGEFAVWNTTDTLGEAAGMVQVKAVLATDAAGAGAYPTAWRTAVVDPDAEGAATTEVGPGSVNLLTGDYAVSSTDVEEFGLSVSRTSSSRNTKTGYQLQKQRLSVNQQKISTDTAGFQPGTSAVARNTERGYESTDSLEVRPTADTQWGSDTFAEVDSAYKVTLGMKPGRLYRFTGWVYVPAATGLSPQDGRGLRLVGYSKTGSEYRQFTSLRPTAVDAWQYLIVDMAVPADATEAFFRLYNGFGAGSGKKVYYDNLSVREITTPFGPQWETGATVDAADIDYTRLSFPAESEGGAKIETANGGSVWFTKALDGKFWPEPGAEDLRLTFDGTVYRLAELDGTVTTFAKAAGGDMYLVQDATPPTTSSTTRFTYQQVDDRVRVHRVIAPLEPGVGDCTTPTPARGCEVLEYDYAPSTTATGSAFGDFTEQVRSIGVWTTDPTTGAVSKVDVARYAYDDKGRLREVWDPRLAQPLKNTYAYDDAGRVVELGASGELPWQLSFGKAGTGDENAGRLLKVRRPTLRAGSLDQLDGEIASTVVYGVPLTRGAGGPHDLDGATISTWAQIDAPTDAVAVFGPEDPVAVNTASATAPGPDGYRAATVSYLNASGKKVNTAAPGGHIDTNEYDRTGNVVRTLESANRALALGQYPDGDKHLADLGLAQYDSKTRATWLESRTTYSADGIDVLEALGPLHRIALGNDPATLVNARARTTNTYDEGKPDGTAYHLLTTTSTGARVVGMSGDQDVRTSRNVYDAVLGGTSGWTLRKPTKVVTAVETDTPMEALSRYDDQGRAREGRKVDSTGADAGTSLSIFYSAGPNSEDAACGNRPEWAGQACVVRRAGAVTGHDTARMTTDLPVKRVESYTRFGEPERIVETAAGKTRQTLITLDGADRTVRVEITGDLGEPVQMVSTDYDADGDAVRTKFADGTKVERVFDKLGRLAKYTDADGAWTSTEFDRFGKPMRITDSLGTSQSFTYDRAAEPRGFLTSVTDSVAGTMTANYGPDGQLVGMDLPGGVRMDQKLDPTGVPVSRSYTKDSALIADSAVVENVHGQWLRHTGPGSDKSYTYDFMGRLTKVADTSTASGQCTVRVYTYDRRTNRTGKTTRTGASAGACPADSEPAQTESHTYDSADRLTDAGWVYDAFGRITATPGGVTNSYHVNDLVRSQQTADSRMSWSLDPVLRLRSFVSEKLVNGAWANAVTKVNHYSEDSDEPRWIAEDVTQNNNVTRNVSSPEGDLAVTTGLAGEVTLQLTNLHGDVMSTVPVVEGQLGAVTVLDADEFGVPSASTPAAAGSRYGWLGGKQRSTEALGGVVLMGVRLYHPGTGRFWQVDPEDGGNATEYDYCAGDPVNCTDLDGRWGWLKRALTVVAKVAEVISYIPGPIGAAAAAVSSVAYASTGNWAKAGEMAITAAAGLVGANTAVKAGFAAVKVAAKTVPKMASRAVKSVRSVASRGRAGCNSFAPSTPVLMADGTTRAISDVEVGDHVVTTDPKTGRSLAQPVLNVIVGYGAKNLVELDLDPSTPGVLTATADHPIWVQDRGWVDAKDVRVGDRVRDADGTTAPVARTTNRGRLANTLVYNLTIGATHTFQVLVDNLAILVHNSSCNIAAHGVPRAKGLYVIHLKNGKKYVGISKNMHTRIHRHLTSRKGALKREGLGVNDIARIQTHTTKMSRSNLRKMEKRVIARYGGPTKGRGTLYNRSW